jgi:hypothetical protein
LESRNINYGVIVPINIIMIIKRQSQAALGQPAQTTQQRLSAAQAAEERKRAQYNVLATEMRGLRANLDAVRAKPQSASNQAEINRINTALRAKEPQLAQLRTELDNAVSTKNSIRALADREAQATAVATRREEERQEEAAEAEAEPEGREIVVNGHRDRLDHRVRLSAYRGEEDIVYGTGDRTNNILTPLHATQGLMFPYTPSIQVSQDTAWQAADLEHVNYDILSFQKSSSASISVTGKFTVQNQREGEYLLAAIHFLRTVSKAYFGAQDVEQFVAPQQDTPEAQRTGSPGEIEKERQNGRAGLPPPVLLFSGYGTMMFNDLRVVVKSHSWSFEESSDYIPIRLPSNGTVWLPPLMTINISLAIQPNTDRLREHFSLDEFRTGELLKKRGWF